MENKLDDILKEQEIKENLKTRKTINSTILVIEAILIFVVVFNDAKMNYWFLLLLVLNILNLIVIPCVKDKYPIK